MRSARNSVTTFLASLVLLAGVLAGPDAAADSFVPPPAAEAPPELAPVDRVLVRKSERRMYLYRADRLVRSYRVSLGLAPSGPKQREGDFRTPEGVYYLTRRNPQSDFFLSVQVSYPSDEDVAIARRQGVRPGGLIMVHGLPNVPRYSKSQYLQNDWTDGCIALGNDDMLEFWLLTQANTPIEIRP